MRLLDRYLLRELLIPLGFCLCGFLIFWIAFDLIGRMSYYQDHGLSFREMVVYYVLRMPEFLVLILPMVLLLALLYALTNHARHNELTAIRAAGVSLWRICVPYLVVGLLLSALLFALNELGVPDCSARAKRILHRRDPEQAGAADPRTVSGLGLKNDRDGRTWFIESYDLKTDAMDRVRVDWEDRDAARWELVARHAEYRDGQWVFGDVQEFRKPPGPNTYGALVAQTNELAVPDFTETPSDFHRENDFSRWFAQSHDPQDSVEVPLREILDYLELHPELSARNRAELYTQLHEQLATPWECLVVVLVAIPFAAASGRRNVFVGVASSIGIVFAYYVVQHIGLAMGISGMAPPWLAAWLPNVCFAAAGLLMMARVR